MLDWFVLSSSQNTRNEIILANQNVGTFLKETERAIQLRFLLSLGTDGILWLPKAAVLPLDEYDKAKEMGTLPPLRLASDEDKEEYARLLAFARKNKIKGARRRLRAETLLRLIRESGLECKSLKNNK